jgi:predicted extracellular nuclease
MRTLGAVCLAAILALLGAQAASALTIRDIQYASPPDYASPYLGQTVAVTGGIVTKIFVGGSTKITIQDPTLGDEWAGIQLVFSNGGQAAGIARGDQIDVSGAVVAEYRGNTQLTMSASSTFVINSSGNVVAPHVVSVSEIPNPVNHDFSEKYEFMLLKVEGVHVGQTGLGKNADNYELVNGSGVCWASDYANADLPPGQTYYVAPGQSFTSITGYLEQYLRPEQGWDYYQLLPRDTGDYGTEPSPVRVTTWGAVKAQFR